MTRNARMALTLLVLVGTMTSFTTTASAGEPDWSIISLARPELCYASTGEAGIGYGFAGALLTIDVTTGEATVIGDDPFFGEFPDSPNSPDGMPGLAINSLGEIFATNSNENGLYRVDAVTAKTYLVAPITGPASVDIDGIAFDEDDVLWCANDNGVADTLFTMNTDTGVATAVGPLQTAGGAVKPPIRGLAFDPTTNPYTLYASTGSGSDDIYTVDLITTPGELTLVGSTGLGNSIPDIHFDSSGQLYCVSTGSVPRGFPGESDFFELDKNNNATPMLVGPTGFRAVSGLATRFGCNPYPVSRRHGDNEQAIHLGTTKDAGWSPCGPAPPNAKKCWVGRVDLPSNCAGLLTCLTIESAGNDANHGEVFLNGSSLGFLVIDTNEVDTPNCTFVTTTFNDVSVTTGLNEIKICNTDPQKDFIFHAVTLGCPTALTICPEPKKTNFSVTQTDSFAVIFTGIKDDVQGYSLDILFDPTHLKYENVVSKGPATDMLPWLGITENCVGCDGVDPDTLRFNQLTLAAAPVALASGDTLAFCHFSEVSGAPMQTTVTASMVSLGTEAEGTIDLDTCFGLINFASCPKDGDIDGDGDIDFNDVFCTFRCVQLQQSGMPPEMPPGTSCVNTLNTPCEAETADISCDGECDPCDLLWLVDRFTICGGGPLECGAANPGLCAFTTPPCPAAAAIPPADVSTLRIDDLGVKAGEVVRIPLHVQGSGTLRVFSIDLVCPKGLEIVDLEPSEQTASWMGLGQSQPNLGEIRLAGFDSEGLNLTAESWVNLGTLVVRATEEATNGRFELARASGPGLQNMRLLGGGTAVSGHSGTQFELGAARPNPFRGTVGIDYVVPAGTPENVEIKIFNVQGRVVKVLVDEARTAGRHTVEWNGTDDSGARVASGTYFYRMQAGSFQATKKLVRTN